LIFLWALTVTKMGRCQRPGTRKNKKVT
jgi:hypothetical protein